MFDTLLQILEEGRLTDGAGSTVDFSGTTVILTSNHGSSGRSVTGFVPDKSEKIMASVKDAFRPEFLNRLDAVVPFKELTSEHAVVITMNAISAVVDLAHSAGVEVRVDEKVYALVAATGFNSEFGARSLRRAVQNMITDPLADYLIRGESVVEVTVAGSEILLTPVKATKQELVF